MDWLWNLLDPTWWLTILGAFATVGVLAIIFAETGLLLGFFLPGDSLLVAAGIFSSASVAQGMGIAPLSFPVLLIGTPLCAVAGAQLGHFLGVRFGRKLFDKPDSRLFKREHVVRAEEFFQKFGPARAVILARFVPIVRTFMNPVAGVLEMPGKRFFLWNVIGALVWVESLLLLGHFLGGSVDPKQIDKYILPGVFLIVLISLIPIFVEAIKHRRGGKNLTEPNGKHHRMQSQSDIQQ
ncbi:DedA family protein [Nonomuraea sp. NPDC046802]|uniref:DedA family protein n=1 Tax=Nonomuraea sp. NPDC046802 TaxID=3154919 RepID=UPI0033F02F28